MRQKVMQHHLDNKGTLQKMFFSLGQNIHSDQDRIKQN